MSLQGDAMGLESKRYHPGARKSDKLQPGAVAVSFCKGNDHERIRRTACRCENGNYKK